MTAESDLAKPSRLSNGKVFSCSAPIVQDGIDSRNTEFDLSNQLEVKAISAIPQLEGLEKDWSRLLERIGAKSPFVAVSWIVLCAKYLEPKERMLVLTMWRSGALVGAIPMIDSRSWVRGFPVRHLRSLVNPLTGYSEIIAEEPESCLDALLHFLSSQKQWQAVIFDRIREASRGLAALSSTLARRSWITVSREVSRTPYLEIKGTLDEFWRSKSSKFRKTRRSISNRIEKLGGVTVECITGGGREQTALAEFLELSRKSWTRTGGRDLLAEEFEQRFLQDLTKLAAQKGWLRFWFLRKDADLIAAEFHLRDGDVEYGLRAHYDPAYSYQSPGTFLDVSVVRRLFEDGCRIYDMGPGMVNYKLAWTTSAYACFSVTVFQRGMYAGFLGRLESVWIPALRNTALGRWWAVRKQPGAAPGTPEEHDDE